MTITEQALQEMLKRNKQVSLSENNVKSPVQRTVAKRDETPTLVRTKKREDRGVPSVTVKFVGYRVRPLDPDNFAGGCKDLLDGLRHSGIISGDDPYQIKLETSQVKVSRFSQEYTLIEIES